MLRTPIPRRSFHSPRGRLSVDEAELRRRCRGCSAGTSRVSHHASGGGIGPLHGHAPSPRCPACAESLSQADMPPIPRQPVAGVVCVPSPRPPVCLRRP